MLYCETIKDKLHAYTHAIIKKSLYNKMINKVGKEFFETTFPTTKYCFSRICEKGYESDLQNEYYDSWTQYLDKHK